MNFNDGQPDSKQKPVRIWNGAKELGKKGDGSFEVKS